MSHHLRGASIGWFGTDTTGRFGVPSPEPRMSPEGRRRVYASSISIP